MKTDADINKDKDMNEESMRKAPKGMVMDPTECGDCKAVEDDEQPGMYTCDCSKTPP